MRRFGPSMRWRSYSRSASATVVEVWPGRLKLDHHIAGDHIVRANSAAELRGVNATEHEVMIHTRNGFLVIGHHLRPEARRAVADVIETVVWGELKIGERD